MTTKLSTYTHTIDSSLNEEVQQLYQCPKIQSKRENGSREKDRAKN